MDPAVAFEESKGVDVASGGGIDPYGPKFGGGSGLITPTKTTLQMSERPTTTKLDIVITTARKHVVRSPEGKREEYL